MKVIFPAKGLSAVLALEFDYTSQLGAGVTLTGAAVTAGVYSGVDGTPSALLSGSAVASGSAATQMVSGGVAGTIYSLACLATTSDGQTLPLQGFLAVQGDPV